MLCWNFTSYNILNCKKITSAKSASLYFFIAPMYMGSNLNSTSSSFIYWGLCLTTNLSPPWKSLYIYVKSSSSKNGSVVRARAPVTIWNYNNWILYLQLLHKISVWRQNNNNKCHVSPKWLPPDPPGALCSWNYVCGTWREVRRASNVYFRYAMSAEVAKKCNFRGFFNFSQNRSIGICSDSLQMLSWPFPIIPRARIWCTISLRVNPNIRAVCECKTNGRNSSTWKSEK